MGAWAIVLVELVALLMTASAGDEVFAWVSEEDNATVANLSEFSINAMYAEKAEGIVTFRFPAQEELSLEVSNLKNGSVTTTPGSEAQAEAGDSSTKRTTSEHSNREATTSASTTVGISPRVLRARAPETITKAATATVSESYAERVDGASLVSVTALTSKQHKCAPSLALPVDPRATYPPGQVWHANGTDWYCPCNYRPCLWMCCPKGQALKSHNFSLDCVDTVGSLLFMQVEDMHGTSQETRISHFFLRHEAICPKKRIKLEPESYPEDRYILHANGTLTVPESKPPVFTPGKFCVGFSENDVSVPVVLTCVTDGTGTPELVAAHVVYSCFMIFSLPFLLVTFVVYALLPRLQNLHGKIVMSHVAVLFTAYLTLIIVQLCSPSFSDGTCKFAAFIIYFAFLASFFWLNVMCLDIWWTFSGFRPLRGSVKEREHKKFIIYSLYCWGSPLLMLIICLIMDLHPGIPESYEKPGFGEKKCWFRSNVSNLIYFNGPIAILIVCNIVLFILTAIKICQVKRGAKILKKQDSRRHYNEEENNTRRFNLYLKLFLVMGVNWIMEVISFAAGGPDEWWYVTDIANTLQGVLIFIIFVCKRRIWRLLKERFWPSGLANTSSMANSSTRMTAIRRNGSEMSSGRSSLKTPEGQSMKALAAAAPPVRSDDSDAA